jgi:uncharacterized membrane protein
MNKLYKIKMTAVSLALLAMTIIIPTSIHARDASSINDWYIKDFKSEIVVNKDSSLSITEDITADCGNLLDKHGIFRILPTQMKVNNNLVKTPVKLESITDFNGNKLKYSVTKDYSKNTITWKIGDQNKSINGVNYYRIKYSVKNTIRLTNNGDFDELYWNLNGAFWQIETDKFTGTIKFPAEITEKNTQISAYSGIAGAKTNNSSTYSWLDQSTLQFISSKTLKPDEVITASITFPKNIISPYSPSFIEKYGQLLFFLFPIFIFLLCLNIWRRFGKDFKLNRPVMAEYEIPDSLSPIEFSILYGNGQLRNEAISASIINLAVKSYLKIEQLEKNGLFGKKNYKLIKLEGSKAISTVDKSLLAYIFGGATEIELKDLMNKFYSNITRLKDESIEFLSKENYVDKAGYKWQIGFLVAGIITIFAGIYAFVTLFFTLVSALILSGIILIIFAALMPKRTMKGTETFWKMQGFKLFISMTEKYSANFNEKENIFEKFLPYAMLFGLTSIWINNMKKIYGESYFNTYHPYWFYGPMFVNFDAKAFDGMISDLGREMNSAITSAPGGSGANGGGFAGGGGGGGGGGGW